MEHQVTVTYAKPIIRRAIRHFWFRFIAWHGFAVIALSILATVVLIAYGDRSWVTGFLLALSIIFLVMSASVYVVFLRRSLWKFNRMNSKLVVFTFSDDSMATASDLGKSEVSWRAIERIWKFPDVWLLFVAKTVFVTLPIADIDTNIQEYVVAQILKHGGHVS